ncbi:MAG: GMC family oxidoreductase, partial [Solirubrobacterales bacterium]|nr:GMC family oxidoreductase [Solirubrobacterales bacterium]
MISSAAALRNGSTLAADVVIIGGGPMGIVSGLELADAGHRVLMIERGGLKFDPRVQGLSGHAGNDPWHASSDVAIRRQLGGTSTLWGGRCVPFDPIDFAPRPAVPDALWPVEYDEVARYFGRACEWCRCGRPVFDAGALPELADNSMIPGFPDRDVLTTSLERWALPTRFGSFYRKRLKTSQLLELVTGLTCTNIACD